MGAVEEDERILGRKAKENDMNDEESSGTQEDFEIVKEFYDEYYNEGHTGNFDLLPFTDEVIFEDEEFDEVFVALKNIDENLGEEFETIVSDIIKSRDALSSDSDQEYEFIGDEIKALDIEYYDQYNDRLAHSLPVTFSDDMNGADWRSVESIKETLKKLDENLYKRWMIIWYDNYVGQAELYHLYDSLGELFEDYEEMELTEEEEEKKWLDKLYDIYNIPQNLLAKRDFILKAIKDEVRVLQVAPDEIKDDREIVLNAVQNEGVALRFASDKLKNDKEIVLEAIKSWGGDILEFASEEIKNDKDVVKVAIEADEDAIEYASKELQAFFANK